MKSACATASLDAAVESLEKLRTQHPEDRAVLRYLAEAYHGKAGVCLSLELTGAAYHQALLDAEEFFTNSKSLREQLVAVTRGEEARNHNRDLARSWGYLGGLHLMQGDIPKAAEAYGKSKSIREELYRSNPLDPEHRFQYARGLRNFGDMEFRYRGDCQVAIDDLTKALNLQRELIADFPEVGAFKLDYASTCNMLAEAHLQQSSQSPELAEKSLQEAAEAAEDAANHYGSIYRGRTSKRDPSGVHGLALATVLQAAAKQTSDPAESEHLAKQAESLLDDLGQEPVLASHELLTLAFARGLQNKPALAFRALKESVARGENSVLRFEKQKGICLKSLAADEEVAPQLGRLVADMTEKLKME